ncbi:MULTISPECIES: hypothetical protein [unclassified Exiguobacterium]|uniref:hypothetical protein n=1 Tax=unclassified Exiguobacterium TaxID=2644629 RepID=UPI001BED2F67|nr:MULTISPECIES: hypothetical protein [unclassified Exiguobacterium]
MKVLLMGWGDNVYIKRHIENVNLKGSIETSLYTLKVKNKEFLSFYNQNNINLINSDLGNNLIYKIPKVRGWISTYRDVKLLKSNGPYDILHVHFVGLIQCKMIGFLSGDYKKLILSFWGSDLLRANNELIKDLKKVIKKADTITFGSDDMIKKFQDKFGSEYNSKLKLIYFPTTVYSKIDEITFSESLADSKEYFDFPKNKYIVACGYNGSESQKHNEILESINKISPEVLKKMFFVFPMTYGASENYLNEIRSILRKTDIDYVILTEYLNEEMIARLWRCTDIFIHVQSTDGFSSSMRENLYAGTVIINGSWLKYNELEREGHYIHKISTIEELTTSISGIVSDYNLYFANSKINKDAIKKIFSNEDEYLKWANIYLE